jgi:hypothetical protein
MFLVYMARQTFFVLQAIEQPYYGSFEGPSFAISDSTRTVSGFHLPALKTFGLLGAFLAGFDSGTGYVSDP